MDGVTTIIETIGTDPRVWIVLALFAAPAVFSIYRYFRCPIMNGVAKISEDQAKSALNRPMGKSWRFLGIMVLGIALSIFGLIKLAHPDAPPAIALFCLLLGVYMFSTEPSRMDINDAENRYVATGGVGEPAALALDSLRSGHVRLLGFEVGVVALLLVGILAI